jgi:hypothetical protein
MVVLTAPSGPLSFTSLLNMSGTFARLPLSSVSCPVISPSATVLIQHQNRHSRLTVPRQPGNGSNMTIHLSRPIKANLPFESQLHLIIRPTPYSCVQFEAEAAFSSTSAASLLFCLILFSIGLFLIVSNRGVSLPLSLPMPRERVRSSLSSPKFALYGAPEARSLNRDFGPSSHRPADRRDIFTKRPIFPRPLSNECA